ncbi:MAG: hypothetical protein ACOYJ6_01610 [Caulobacterales bacterium]
MFRLACFLGKEAGWNPAVRKRSRSRSAGSPECAATFHEICGGARSIRTWTILLELGDQRGVRKMSRCDAGIARRGLHSLSQFLLKPRQLRGISWRSSSAKRRWIEQERRKDKTSPPIWRGPDVGQID